MENDFCRLIRESALELGISLDDRQVFQFAKYHGELLLWNKKINLISERSSLDIPIKHFIDSLTALPFLNNKDSKVLDIGSGGGFPALPLKIAAPGLEMLLVESSRKKASFLKHCIRSLELCRVTVTTTRVEKLAKSGNYSNGFDAVISRATFKLPDFVSAGAPFLRPGGILIAMKGANFSDELEKTANILQPLGLQLLSCHEIRLPVIGDERNIVLYRKVV